VAQIRGPGIPLFGDSPQNSGRPPVITLPAGGIYDLPQGDYLITTGGQTVLQWANPLNGLWYGVSPPSSTTSITADGGNYRLVNLSGVAVGANITNAGSGGVNGIGPSQTGSTVTFAGTTPAQGYVIVGGSVPAPTVTQGGSGFLVPPLICCDPPPVGGIQATFTSTISVAGVLTGVTQVNPGAGYLAVPQFYIFPQAQISQQQPQYPGGSTTPGVGAGAAGAYPPPGLVNPANVPAGAQFQPNVVSGTAGALLTGVALTGSGTLTGIVVTNYGIGYAGNSVPAVSFGGTSLGAAAATAIMSFCMTAAFGGTVTGTGGTAAVVGSPGISSLGLITGANNNIEFYPRPYRGLITTAAGNSTLEDPGFGLQGAAVTLQGAGTTLITITNTQFGGRTDTSIIQSSVNS
jgi:hypothetical protein